MSDNLKQHIADTLLAIAAEGSVEKITVRQLADRCHISRPTFYKNFSDIFSVTEWALKQKMHEAAQECLRINDRRESIERFAERLSDHLYLVAHFLNTKHRAEMEQILLQGIRYFFDYMLEHSGEYRMLPDAERLFMSEFFSGGIMQYIVNKSNTETMDIKLFGKQMDRLIRATLDQ